MIFSSYLPSKTLRCTFSGSFSPTWRTNHWFLQLLVFFSPADASSITFTLLNMLCHFSLQKKEKIQKERADSFSLSQRCNYNIHSPSLVSLLCFVLPSSPHSTKSKQAAEINLLLAVIMTRLLCLYVSCFNTFCKNPPNNASDWTFQQGSD